MFTFKLQNSNDILNGLANLASSLEKDIKIINNIFKINGNNGVNSIYSKLYNLYKKKGIARFHVILQYIMSAYLYNRGYDVYVEEDIGKGYKADIYAEAPWESLIVEVETGYIPPSRHLDFEDYLIGKIIYKTLVYSQYADKFSIAIPSHLNIRFPRYLLCKRLLNRYNNLKEIIYYIYK
ncbi:MAG: hypothetical protein F7C81_05495, partial [Desulfurococcales archaeon]|nr:hypothetical protein [Desulfurococcales archaeon]